MIKTAVQKFFPTNTGDALAVVPFIKSLFNSNQVIIVEIEKSEQLSIKRGVRTMDRAVKIHSQENKVSRLMKIRNSQTQELALKENFPQIDIDRLSMLAQEESYTMPRGLTREQRRQWARQNIQR